MTSTHKYYRLLGEWMDEESAKLFGVWFTELFLLWSCELIGKAHNLAGCCCSLQFHKPYRRLAYHRTARASTHISTESLERSRYQLNLLQRHPSYERLGLEHRHMKVVGGRHKPRPREERRRCRARHVVLHSQSGGADVGIKTRPNETVYALMT